MFRHFGFVGYKKLEDAEAAVLYFNNTCINTRRINVKICKSLLENEKEKVHIKMGVSANIPELKSETNKNLFDEMKDHKDDPLFLEFMLSHAKDRAVWESDLIDTDGDTLKLNNCKDTNYTEPQNSLKEESKLSNIDVKKTMIDLYTVKLMNTPYNTKRSDIQKFFKPLKPHSIRTRHGFCFAGFKTEVDFKKALSRNRSFMSMYPTTVFFLHSFI